MAYDVQNFQEDVLDASHKTPVVVDFWAPWCGPCQVLGPVLETLAKKSDGRWKLAKINTDQNQELSMQYGIRGIPAVKMFVDGEVVDEFTGALPQHAVEQWLEKAVPSESRLLADDARSAMAEGRVGDARRLLETALKEDASDASAAVTLAQLEVFEHPDRAEKLLNGIELVDPALVQTADGIRVLVRLLSLNGTAGALEEGPGREDYARAIKDLRERNLSSALDGFISVIMKDRYYDDDGARKACLAIFSILGEDNEMVRAHRRRFNMALY
ncbi:MAG: thioredoxin [Rhodothermales bacterium]|nr:thioredoxin [Rhodothermales bacterium]